MYICIYVYIKIWTEIDKKNPWYIFSLRRDIEKLQNVDFDFLTMIFFPSEKLIKDTNLIAQTCSCSTFFFVKFILYLVLFLWYFISFPLCISLVNSRFHFLALKTFWSKERTDQINFQINSEKKNNNISVFVLLLHFHFNLDLSFFFLIF